MLPKLIEAGKTVHGHVVTDPTLTLGVNDRVELAKVRKLAQQRIHDEHSATGSRSSTPTARSSRPA